ncbi:hemolysin family protein [Peribacillus simplex]|uniref:Hemolysin family protein n=2 Tax=Peribacillus TaxID=2675229 RepID=A0AA90PE56_9BACI|nr:MULTISPECIES: hemolysin family protein [Peribacillus]MDP1419004.1 hemolysin family protein [Peribacillus simplex]MDP1451697.1 hemolysin family protein [Peribacillus frigoritolerans]
MDIINLVLIAILIALTAFFVATEFAIVKVRSTRVDQLIEEGTPNALSAKKVISNLDEYLSTCQLGITVTALGLGVLGEPTVENILRPLLNQLNLPNSASHALSVAIAFSFITFIHVVVGELAPKTLAIQKAEQVTLLVSKPLIGFNKIMYPFIWVLNGSARTLTRMLGLKAVSEHDLAHTEEELRIIVSESYKSGEINQSEFKYVNKIFEFDDRIAKEIMVPRTEIATVSKDDTIQQFFTVMAEENFTRYPVIDGDKDHVIGMVNIKELFTEMIDKNNQAASTINRYVRPIIRVIDSIPIHDLLLKMQKERVHMAILMDEYGGTSGLVTVEDILEEIVGDIRDEFDLDEVPDVRKLKEDHYIIDAKVLVSEMNDLLGLDINDEDIDTMGGWILTENYEAKQGDILTYGPYNFRIKEMEDHHIRYIEIYKPAKVVTEVKEFPMISQTEIVS